MTILAEKYRQRSQKVDQIRAKNYLLGEQLEDQVFLFLQWFS